jgi:hypothetical protein
MSLSRPLPSVLSVLAVLAFAHDSIAVDVFSPASGTTVSVGSTINFKARVPVSTANGMLDTSTVYVKLLDSNQTVLATPAFTSYFESPTNSFVYQSDSSNPSSYPNTPGYYTILVGASYTNGFSSNLETGARTVDAQ